MHLKTLTKEVIENKKVIVRLDLNVPFENAKILDRTRIEMARETLTFLCKYASKVIILAHFGRPNGREPYLSTQFLVQELVTLLKTPVGFAHNIEDLGENDKVLLLENIRFWKEEEEDNTEFAKSIASYGDIYVNEAFSCAHRNHASNHAITKYLSAYPGFALAREVEILERFLNYNDTTIAIIAGKKVSTKFKVLTNLAAQCSKIIVGGAMANTFLAASGCDMKASYVEQSFIDEAKQFLSKNRDKIILPTDLICLNGDTIYTRDASHLQDGDIAYDIGPVSIRLFEDAIGSASRVLWNGPLGYYEDARFNKASLEVARFISSSKKESLIGGGDTLAALAGHDFDFTYVSSAGGALLEYLEGAKFKTIEALT